LIRDPAVAPATAGELAQLGHRHVPTAALCVAPNPSRTAFGTAFARGDPEAADRHSGRGVSRHRAQRYVAAGR
jgi:hypothetical protein